MCCSEPDDVSFMFEFVRMWQIIKFYDFCGIRYAFTAANGVVGHFADGGALYCLIGGRRFFFRGLLLVSYDLQLSHFVS